MRSARIIESEYEIETVDGDSYSTDPIVISDDIYEFDPDELIQDEITPVDAIVDLLTDRGCTEPSCAPSWSIGTWYSSQSSMDMQGIYNETSIHLTGWTEKEEKEIYRRITMV